MSVRPRLSVPGRLIPGLLVLATTIPGTAAQEQKHIAFPERDALTPFRTPSEVYAPPDRLYGLLRRMRAIAADPSNRRRVDAQGCEVIESDTWRDMRNEVERIGIDAGYLASIMRMSKNDDDRRTAFYAAFYCKRVDYVLNLISHIPGEPLRATRQEAFPRAVDYLLVHLPRRFGDLDKEQQEAILAEMPEVGSPAAKARGIVRAPRDDDHLHELRLTPFFQLLDVDTAIDQAQAAWFLAHVFSMRPDLAQLWLEPVLPRLRQLLIGDDGDVRKQIIGLFAVIGPADLATPEPDADAETLLKFAETAARKLFPPIRNLNDALIQLFPSPERTLIAETAKAALATSSIGDPYRGKNAAGQWFNGFRVATVPAELEPLAIPKGAIITTVNGTPVRDAKSLLQTAGDLILKLPHPRTLFVEYVLDDVTHAVEYRIM
ncbi:MAG: hypothetical protein KDC98_20675 [Planctomycetes bacterium]|nr:hypothetical protein [Planctomycetota bacterium]